MRIAEAEAASVVDEAQMRSAVDSLDKMESMLQEGDGEDGMPVGRGPKRMRWVNSKRYTRSLTNRRYSSERSCQNRRYNNSSNGRDKPKTPRSITSKSTKPIPSNNI